MSAVTHRCGVQRAGRHVRDSAGHRCSVSLYAHRHRVRLDAVDEVHRPVDGVEHPREPSVAAVVRSALLLTQDGFPWAQDSQPVAQQRLGLGVDDGDGIGRSALGTHRRRGVLRRVAEHFGAARSDKRSRLRGQLLGYRTQQDGRSVSFSTTRLSQHSPSARGPVARLAPALPRDHTEFSRAIKVCGASQCRAEAEERR